ncbi:MAG: fused MFS/spermidine synthase [Bowdeniella nasicola]|nr:fused MFS/spermidine synthase [Bowdeniella nasicola]
MAHVRTSFPVGPLPTAMGTAEFEPITPTAALLLLDGMESSYVDLADPSHLEFEYMQQMDLALAAHIPAPTPIRALHLGGAACTLARAWNATRPGSKQVVLEWDAKVGELARAFCDVPRAPAVKIRIQDARAGLDGFPANRFEVIVRDTFANGQVPDHLRTLGVAQAARRVLGERGLYLANLTDHPPLMMTRSEVQTIGAVFRHVLVIADPAILRGRRFGNLVICASDTPFITSQLIRQLRCLPLPVTTLLGDKLTAFTGTAPLLTDCP